MSYRTYIHAVSVLKRLSLYLRDILFPLECLGCGREGTLICPDCLNRLEPFPLWHCPFCERTSSFGAPCKRCRKKHALDGAMAGFPYANPLIRLLIHAWKYDGARELSAPLADLAWKGINSALGRNHRVDPEVPSPFHETRAVILCPIPLHPRRLSERGFNQAEDLARLMAERMSGHGWQFKSLLIRNKQGEAQARLSPAERLVNVRGSFALVPEAADIKGENIILVDDVLTTGSTCEAAARVLKNAGARSVWALALAYGHPVKK